MENNSNNLWINKWKPSNIIDVIGNKQAISKIDEWLSKFDKHTNNTIIINGAHGIGKSLVVDILLKKYNYISKVIYSDELKNFRNGVDVDFDDYYNYDNSVFSKFKMSSKKDTMQNKKIAIVFDEIDTISLSSEKKFVFNIFKNNLKMKSFPLIFISNTNHSKLLNDLKKYCTEIKFYSPSSYDITKFIQKVCKEENIDIKDNESIEQLIQFSQYDIRRLINVLQEYSYNYNNINIKDIKTYISKSITKDIGIGLFEASLELLNNENNFEQIYKLYEIDKVLIPLMVYENYYKKIISLKNKITIDEQIEKMVNISESISIGDNIETSIYTDQNWYLQDIHSFYTCYNTSYLANNTNIKKITASEIKFSADLNKTSLKNINKKNILNLEKIIGNKTIEEILLICKLSNYMISTKQSQHILNILKSYKDDFDIKDLELCLKIDKTIDFITLSTKEKKEINNLMD
uniref:AAA+ ATPase domain-containing protein n=1 Tax=viral metagenome TaxID=1070528 RepID=A0A6C0HUY9_9ZZZZ